MTAPRPAYVARLGLDTREERAPLAVAGPTGAVGWSTSLHLWGAQHHPEGPERDDQDDDLRAGADEELHAAGWVRSGPWETGADPRAVTAPLRARDRQDVDGPTQAVLDALWAVGPPATAAQVAAAADVSSQRARGALVRLVVAGHARHVGQTTERTPRDLYAAVGSVLAPDRADLLPLGPA